MRLFEIFFIISIVLFLFSMNKKRGSVFTLLSVVIFGVHFFVEGLRWQLSLAYLVFLVMAIALFFKLNLKRKWMRLLIFSCALVGMILTVGLAYFFPVFSVPKTTGAYLIASKEYQADSAKSQFKIWYPIQNTTPAPQKATYYSNTANKSIMGLPSFFISHFRLVTTNAYTSGQLTAQRFPLVIYSHGAGSLMADNTALLEEVASNGYVVVAVDHDFSFKTYGITENDARRVDTTVQKEIIKKLLNKAVPNQIHDYRSVLEWLRKDDDLAHTINFSQIALVGHSLGGSTATAAALTIPHVKAVVNIDGPIKTDVMVDYEIPFLYISSFSPTIADHEIEQFGVDPTFYKAVKNFELKPIVQFFKSNPINAYWVRFKYANHLDLTDMPFVIPALKSKNYDALKGQRLKNTIVLNFLNQFLKQQTTVELIDESIVWLKQ